MIASLCYQKYKKSYLKVIDALRARLLIILLLLLLLLYVPLP